MSKAPTATLFIEWTPGRVRALDGVTGRMAEGVSLGDLGGILAGHRSALVGIGRSATFVKTVALPRAAREDLRALLMTRLGLLLPIPASQLAFDFLQTDESSPEGFVTLIAAMRASDLKQLQSELAQASLRAARIVPMALVAPVAATKEGRRDALVIREDARQRTMDVVQGGVLRFSRSAPPEGEREPEARRTLAAAGADELPRIVLDDSGADLRLLPETPALAFELTEEREKVLRKRVADRTRLSGLLLAAGVLLATLLWADRSDDYARRRKAEGVWARELSKRRSILNLEVGKAQKATTVQETLETALSPGQHLSDAVAAIGDALPAGVWLTGLSLERGKPLQLRGTAREAASIARLVESLASNRRFRDVRLVFANSGKIKETPVVQFNITAFPVGNLPMPEVQKVKKKGTKAK